MLRKRCITVCKTVEKHYRATYYVQLAQVMIAAISKEIELEKTCYPEGDVKVDLDDNEQDLDRFHRRPLKGISIRNNASRMRTLCGGGWR